MSLPKRRESLDAIENLVASGSPTDVHDTHSPQNGSTNLPKVARFLGVGFVVTILGIVLGSAQFPGVAFDPHYPQGRDNIMMVFGCSLVAGFTLGLLAAFFPLGRRREP